MKNLGVDWITENLVDFEYKKYILLDYLQYVSNNFNDMKLYPIISDLITHHKNLIKLKDLKSNLKIGDIESINVDTYEIHRKEDDMMSEIEDIINYSIPKFKKYILEGRDIYDIVEKNICISTVGISPIYKYSGYVLLTQSDVVKVYEYEIGLFGDAEDNYRGIHTEFISDYDTFLDHSIIKLDLVKSRKLPNPATYSIHSKINAPLEECILPISKRILVKYIG